MLKEGDPLPIISNEDRELIEYLSDMQKAFQFGQAIGDLFAQGRGLHHSETLNAPRWGDTDGLIGSHLPCHHSSVPIFYVVPEQKEVAHRENHHQLQPSPTFKAPITYLQMIYDDQKDYPNENDDDEEDLPHLEGEE